MRIEGNYLGLRSFRGMEGRRQGNFVISACRCKVCFTWLPELPGFMKGFHFNAFVGLELIAAAYLGKLMRARRDESQLKKMYIAENDERSGLILRNASTLGLSAILVGLGVAAIVSGFFGATVFFTLLGCLLFVLIVLFALWIYFAKKL